jgi:hypothetical protein
MADSRHSEAFLAVRALLLALEDTDRRRLTGLYGSMTEKLPDPSPALRAFLGEIAKLDSADHLRLARWVRTYVSRYGQVPVAASRSIAAPKRVRVPE